MAELSRTSLYSDANLQHYWPFEGDSNDAKGSLNGSDNLITYGTSHGKFKQGANFNGSSSKITFATGLPISGHVTFAAWVRFSSNPSGDTAILKDFDYQGSFNYYGMFLGINSAGKAKFLSGKNSGRTQGSDWQQVVGSTALNDGKFHFIVGVFDGSDLYIYVDGQSDATPVSWPHNSSSKPAAAMGFLNPSAGVNIYFDGDIDDTYVFDRALTTTEILTLYRNRGGAALMGIL